MARLRFAPDPEGGGLTDVSLDGAPILDRVYAAVRDTEWGTVRPSSRHIRASEGGFSAEETYSEGLRSVFTVSRDGEVLTVSYEAEVTRAFRRNRIGLCLLHPASVAGERASVLRGASEVATRWPALPVAEQPMGEFGALTGLRYRGARLSLAGEEFETEDQRNWTDASFKTFGTPLRLPFPVTVRPGDVIRQRLVIEPDRARTAVGVGTHPSNGPLPAVSADHVRIDVDPERPAWREEVASSASSGLPVELALLLKPGESSVAGEARAILAGVPLARVLALPRREWTDRAPDHGALVAMARAAFQGVPIFAGTDSDFWFLNRWRPGAEADGLCFAVHPQAHASDERSIMSSVATLPLLARAAEEIGDGRPVAVSSLTFAPRHNPYRRDEVARGEPVTDKRPFGAEYLRAALAALRAAGVASVTVGESHGLRGLGLGVLER